jgi:GNAT superfamily N-acetyltransferase
MERVEETARRIEDALARHAQSFAAALARLEPKLAARSLAVGGGTAVHAGPGSPASLAVGLLGDIADADLDAIEKVIGTPSRIELTPFAAAALPKLLGDRGYRVVEWRQVLARPLETPFPEGPGIVDVAQIRPGDSAPWASLVAASFQEDLPSADARLLLAATSTEGAACFIARVRGEPAGGAAVFVSASRAAVLTGAGVLPRFRGLGVQRALIAARLSYARESGADVAASSTLPNSLSQKNLERLGFRILYPKVVLARG